MRKFKNFIVLFSLVYAGLTTSKIFGQCSITVDSLFKVSPYTAVTLNVANAYSPNQWGCIDTCGPTCPTYRVVFLISGAGCGTLTQSMVTITPDGLRTVALGNTSYNATNPTKMRRYFKAAGICKGRITAAITYPAGSGPCPSGGSISKSIDIFKNILAYPSGVAGAQCVTPGKAFTMSINPAIQCPKDGLGIDRIVWNNISALITSGMTPYYASGDSTSVTLNVPATWPNAGTTFPIVITTKVGQCKQFQTPSLSIYRSATFVGITGAKRPTPGDGTYSGFCQGWAGVSTVTGATVCQTLLGSDSILLTANGNDKSSSLFVWTLPSGGFTVDQTFVNADGVSWNTATPVGNVRYLKIKPIIPWAAGTTAGASGRFALSVTGLGGCGTNAGSFTIIRSLNKDSLNNGTLNKLTVSGAGLADSCIQPNRDIIVTLVNPPGNSLFRWTMPNSGWKIISPTGQSGNILETSSFAITVRVDPGATAGKISVSSIGTCVTGGSPATVTCGQLIETLTYPIAGPGVITKSFTKPAGFSGSGRTITYTITGGTACTNFTQYDYAFTYTGKYNVATNPPTTQYTNACGGPYFTGITNCTDNGGNNYVNLTIGYHNNASVKVVVRSTATVGRRCPVKVCYLDSATYTLTDGYYGPTFLRNSFHDDGGFILAPNPPDDKGRTILTLSEGMAEKGIIEIRSIHGNLMRSFPVQGKTTELDLKNLKLGVYQVILVQTGGRFTRSMVLE